MAGLAVASYAILVISGCSDLFAVIKEWQTLIAGIFGVLAAVGTIWMIGQQVAQVDRHDLEARTRRNYAARASISHTLSDLLANESSVIQQLKAALEAEGPSIPFKYGVFATSRSLGIWNLINCIVDAEPRPAGEISRLVSELQVQQSRLEPDVRRHHGGSHEVRTSVEHYLIDALIIYGRAQRLLYYARREDGEYERLSLITSIRNACFLNQTDDLNRSFGETLEGRLSKLNE